MIENKYVAKLTVVRVNLCLKLVNALFVTVSAHGIESVARILAIALFILSLFFLLKVE